MDKNVLARLESFNGNFDVPVIRRDDADDIDIVAFEDLAVVLVAVRFALADVFVVLGAFHVA